MRAVKVFNRTRKGEFEPNPCATEMHARSPVNKQAAAVLSTGFKYEYAPKGPPPKKFDESAIKPLSPAAMSICGDLAGLRYAGGRMTVLGYTRSKKTNKQNHHYFLVRCSCGKIVERKHRAILNKDNVTDGCEWCSHVESLRHKSLWIALGRKR